ncbi:hypothetical protein D3C72_377110 [compost metagenome]
MIGSGIDPAFTIDVIRTGAALDQIIAVEAPQEIVATSAFEHIRISATADFIGKGAPRHTPDVLTRIVILERSIQRPIGRIATQPDVDAAIRSFERHGVGSGPTIHDVAVAIAFDDEGVVPRPAIERIGAKSPDQDVVAVLAVQDIIAVAARQVVVIGASEQLVGARSAEKHVIPGAAIEDVVSALAVQPVPARHAAERVVCAAAHHDVISAGDGDSDLFLVLVAVLVVARFPMGLDAHVAPDDRSRRGGEVQEIVTRRIANRPLDVTNLREVIDANSVAALAPIQSRPARDLHRRLGEEGVGVRFSCSTHPEAKAHIGGVRRGGKGGAQLAELGQITVRSASLQRRTAER